MYLSSGRGRKSGGARATGATPSLAPLPIYLLLQFAIFKSIYIYTQDTWQLSVNSCFDIDCYSILIAKNSMFKLQCHAITRIDGVLELVIVLARH